MSDIIGDARFLYDAWRHKDDPTEVAEVLALIRANVVLADVHNHEANALIDVLAMIINEQEAAIKRLTDEQIRGEHGLNWADHQPKSGPGSRY